MAKERKHLEDSLLLKAARDSDICPVCLAKGKIRHREDDKMFVHYTKKHPKERIPDKFYKGPRDMFGTPIPEYSGPFPVGTRVRVAGFLDAPKVCPICAKVRNTREKMRKHYDKKHPSRAYPDKGPFDMHIEINREIEEGYELHPIKGTVFGVTPAGYGGPRIPAMIHVRLDRPIDIHSSQGRNLSKREVYYSRNSMTCPERELKRLVKKRG